MHIVYGLLAIATGTVMLKFNFQLVGFTGRQDWIESKLGQGSTYLAYKLLAIVVVFFGIIWTIGLGNNLLNWLLSPLKHLFNTPR